MQVDGHLRLELARGERTIPVTYVELSEDEERLVLPPDPLVAAETVRADRGRAKFQSRPDREKVQIGDVRALPDRKSLQCRRRIVPGKACLPINIGNRMT